MTTLHEAASDIVAHCHGSYVHNADDGCWGRLDSALDAPVTASVTATKEQWAAVAELAKMSLRPITVIGDIPGDTENVIIAMDTPDLTPTPLIWVIGPEGNTGYYSRAARSYLGLEDRG